MYRVLKNVLPAEDCDILAGIIRKQPDNDEDGQVEKATGYYGIPCINVLLGLLNTIMETETGKRMKPTYSYCRIYRKNSELLRHKDRESCEYSLTLNLSQSHEWPIYMGEDGVILQKGDACMYQGCEIEHHRKPFEGDEYIQVFLHYVDADGPNTTHAWDAIQYNKSSYCFFKFQPVSMVTDTIAIKENLFSLKECEDIVDQFTAFNTANIGDIIGEINKSYRTSRICWIPKIEKNRWIYERLFDAVASANKDFFKMDLSEIIENIQYTEYNENENGHYDWHIDHGVGDKSRRKLSLSVQLTDPSTYEGCDLIFDDNKSASRAIGSCTVFPSYKRHKVTPILKGTRHSLVLWIHGPPLR
jgi:PKHD-type hydroxylase